MDYKKINYIIILALLFVLVSCTNQTSSNLPDNPSDISEPIIDNEDLTEEINTTDSIIDLSTLSINSTDSVVNITENQITITNEGTFEITGTATDVMIYIDASNSDIITLIFNDITISNTYSSFIYIENAGKVIINVAENTINTINDLSLSSYDDDAVIYSKDDLTINGLGLLIINSGLQKGIKANDDLVILDVSLKITSNGHSIKANNKIIIENANITIDTLSDGIKSENTDDLTLSLIYINGGQFDITSYGDGISSAYDLTIYTGYFTIYSGYNNTNVSSTSAKSLKAANNIYLINGDFNITSKDDGLHANNSIIIYDGSYSISSSDDGIHANVSIEIQNGIIDITKSYEGIESKSIYLLGGTISVISEDDAINGSSGTITNTFSMDASDGSLVSISGGTIYLNASGDGLDSNGDVIMSGGTLIISGPSDNGNGAIDYNGSFKLTGGTLIAAGSSGMAQNVSSSTQVSINIGVSSSSIFQLKDSQGNVIVTFNPGKSYQSIVISSPLLSIGSAYYLYTGGSVNSFDSEFEGYYTNAIISAQSQALSFTISSTISSVGQSSINSGPTSPTRP